MVIKVSDHVSQCYTTQDGLVVYSILKDAFLRGGPVEISFSGISDVTSSFVNAAIISLLTDYPIGVVKARLKIVDASKQAADMARRCMKNAEQKFLVAA